MEQITNETETTAGKESKHKLILAFLSGTITPIIVAMIYVAGPIFVPKPSPTPTPIPVPPPINLTNLAGAYDYRASPGEITKEGNKLTGLLLNEDAEEFLQFVGTAEIKISPEGNANIVAKRQFRISHADYEDFLKTKADKKNQIAHWPGPHPFESPVEWGSREDNIFVPQNQKPQLIFFLETQKYQNGNDNGKRNNIGFVISDKLENGGDNKPIEIKGTMYYLVPISKKGSGPTWIKADIVFRKVSSAGQQPYQNYYLQPPVVDEWFKQNGL